MPKQVPQFNGVIFLNYFSYQIKQAHAKMGLFFVTLMSKLFDMEILLVKPENKEQLKAIKAVLKVLNVVFISEKEKPYNKEFVKKIEEGRKQIKEGKISKLDTENLWNYFSPSKNAIGTVKVNPLA